MVLSYNLCNPACTNNVFCLITTVTVSVMVWQPLSVRCSRSVLLWSSMFVHGQGFGCMCHLSISIVWSRLIFLKIANLQSSKATIRWQKLRENSVKPCKIIC